MVVTSTHRRLMGIVDGPVRRPGGDHTCPTLSGQLILLVSKPEDAPYYGPSRSIASRAAGISDRTARSTEYSPKDGLSRSV